MKKDSDLPKGEDDSPAGELQRLRMNIAKLETLIYRGNAVLVDQKKVVLEFPGKNGYVRPGPNSGY